MATVTQERFGRRILKQDIAKRAMSFDEQPFDSNLRCQELADKVISRLGLNRPETPYLGYPPYIGDNPALPDGTLDVDTYLGRSVFIVSLYTDAAWFLQELHQRAYEAYRDAVEQVPSTEQFKVRKPSEIRSPDQYLVRSLSRPISYPDLENPLFEQLVARLKVWIGDRDLWKDWFVDFALAVLDARYMNVLDLTPKVGSPKTSASRHVIGLSAELLRG